MTIIHKYVLCIGSNFEAVTNMKIAEQAINACFPHSHWGKQIETLPEDPDAVIPYLNRIVMIHSILPLKKMRFWCKEMEFLCGRTKFSKHTGVIPLDIDLLSVDGHILRPGDLNKAYVIQAMESLNIF